MENIIMIDKRLKNKIDSLYEYDECYSVRFKDINDTFWFNNKNDLQEFLNMQSRERYCDKSLRKGYFDYINEDGNIARYSVKSIKGFITILTEEVVQ